MTRDRPSMRQLMGMLTLAGEQVCLRLDSLELDLLSPDQYTEDVLEDLRQEQAQALDLRAAIRAYTARYKPVCRSCRRPLSTTVCPKCFLPYCEAHYIPHVAGCGTVDEPLPVRAGTRLRALRQRARLTQGQLARAVGATESAICGYELNRWKIPGRLIPALAQALQCREDELQGEAHDGAEAS